MEDFGVGNQEVGGSVIGSNQLAVESIKK